MMQSSLELVCQALVLFINCTAEPGRLALFYVHNSPNISQFSIYATVSSSDYLDPGDCTQLIVFFSDTGICQM